MSDGLYKSLIQRIRSEISDLEQVIDRAQQAWERIQEGSVEEYAFVDSVALNLHGFYSGLEKIFELIARQVDQNLPDGETWHRDLLQQMAQDLPDVRPAVIGQQSMDLIDEFRRFRHLVRNVYTTHLVPEKMIGLVESLPELWPQLRAELLAFADYLEALNASLSD